MKIIEFTDAWAYSPNGYNTTNVQVGSIVELSDDLADLALDAKVGSQVDVAYVAKLQTAIRKAAKAADKAEAEADAADAAAVAARAAALDARAKAQGPNIVLASAEAVIVEQLADDTPAAENVAQDAPAAVDPVQTPALAADPAAQ